MTKKRVLVHSFILALYKIFHKDFCIEYLSDFILDSLVRRFDVIIINSVSTDHKILNPFEDCAERILIGRRRTAKTLQQ